MSGPNKASFYLFDGWAFADFIGVKLLLQTCVCKLGCVDTGSYNISSKA